MPKLVDPNIEIKCGACFASGVASHLKREVVNNETVLYEIDSIGPGDGLSLVVQYKGYLKLSEFPEDWKRHLDKQYFSEVAGGYRTIITASAGENGWDVREKGGGVTVIEKTGHVVRHDNNESRAKIAKLIKTFGSHLAESFHSRATPLKYQAADFLGKIEAMIYPEMYIQKQGRNITESEKEEIRGLAALARLKGWVTTPKDKRTRRLP